MNDWTGYCQRCREKSIGHTMSWFSTELICFDCSDREETHSRYNQAREAESAQVRLGNYNFSGVGYTNE